MPQKITSKFRFVLIQIKIIPNSDFPLATIYYETIFINNRNFLISKHPAIFIKENMDTVDVSRRYHKPDIEFEACRFTIFITQFKKIQI